MEKLKTLFIKYRKTSWLHEYAENGIINFDDLKKIIKEYDSRPLDALVIKGAPQAVPNGGHLQEYFLGEKILLTIPMEEALKDVPQNRLTSEGKITLIWLKLNSIAMYEVRLEREVLGQKIWQTDGKILSRLAL